jgi:hypothetical protein
MDPQLDRNAGPIENARVTPVVPKWKKPLLGRQRGALNLSPDGTRLYVTFGESLTGWIVALDTVHARVATAFGSVASQRKLTAASGVPEAPQSMPKAIFLSPLAPISEA